MLGTRFVGAAPADTTLVNNKYFLESLRLAGLAQESFELGDYDAATAYAEEAFKYAKMSDDYVAQQLDRNEAERNLGTAKRRLDDATAMGGKTQFPDLYKQANTAYTDAAKALSGEKWQEVTTAANKVGAAVEEMERLKAKEVDAALAKAKARLDWATGAKAKALFPEPYNRANTAYSDALKAKGAKDWPGAEGGAAKTIAAVAEI
ncbi:MAG: hypothetical protein LBD74_03995, partial [Spirochaetaceae bacterium]|nr:hypothetical protein [Spirochaetaceae bacterium]